MKFQEERRAENRLRTEISMTPSVSIMESKKQIDEIQMSVEVTRSLNNALIGGIRNRQISSSVILDWKQFEQNQKVKSQFQLKDIEHDQKNVFSYLVQEWNNNQPIKVIYRWVRRFSKPVSPIQIPFLEQEEHIYRGPMLNFRKHGEGTYLILKKFSDNSQQVKNIKGEWVKDILKRGQMIDEKGKQQSLTSNVLKVSMKSHKKITPFMQKNSAIERIRRKTGNSNQLINQIANSESSLASIRDKFKK